MSEFYAPARRDDLGDPATDPPLTVRVQADPADQHARLFDRDAVRAVLTDANLGWPWLLVAGGRVGARLSHDEVRTWPVVPAYAVSAPWTLNAQQTAPAPAAHERGDMDVDAFRGGSSDNRGEVIAGR